MIITGCFMKQYGYYKMHSPTFPYKTVTYIGYTLKQMQRKYREDFNLKGKHIEWIIV